MTEKNKQTKTPVAAADNKATAKHSAGAQKEVPGGRSRQPSNKPADKANTSVNKKSVGQYVRDQKRSRLPAVISSLALVVALSGLFAAYWLWKQGVSDQQNRGQQQAQIQARIDYLSQRQEQSVRNNQAQRDVLQQRLTKELNEQLAALEKQQDVAVEPDWLLAEAEYLIRIADHRIQLIGDIGTAVSALMLADHRLFALRDPRVTVVRRQINNDINRLRSLPEIDTVGIALTLTSLQQQVTALPLNRATRNNSVTPDGETQGNADSKPDFFASIWSSLKGLVSIRRVDDKATAIVPPEQRGFLFQNLALKLEAARFALLSGEDALYHQSLMAVDGWLGIYFDVQSSSVQAMLSSLQKLNNVKLDPMLPDLGASLQAVQSVISLRQKATQQGMGNMSMELSNVVQSPAEQATETGGNEMPGPQDGEKVDGEGPAVTDVAQ